jgi:hypothetical protein
MDFVYRKSKQYTHYRLGEAGLNRDFEDNHKK